MRPSPKARLTVVFDCDHESPALNQVVKRLLKWTLRIHQIRALRVRVEDHEEKLLPKRYEGQIRRDLWGT